MSIGLPVSFWPASESPSFNYSGETPPFGCPRYFNFISGNKNVGDFYAVADFFFFRLSSYLTHSVEAKSKLDGTVAVLFNIFYLPHFHRRRQYPGDRRPFSRLRPGMSHSDFGAKKSLYHDQKNSPSLGLYSLFHWLTYAIGRFSNLKRHRPVLYQITPSEANFHFTLTVLCAVAFFPFCPTAVTVIVCSPGVSDNIWLKFPSLFFLISCPLIVTAAPGSVLPSTATSSPATVSSD